MPRAVSDLEYGGSAATRARRFTRETLRGWDLDGISIEAELVTTELVTNAVLHGAPPISLELTHHDHNLRIAVIDHSAAFPVLTRPGTDAMTGRGLALVTSLSSRWGIEPGVRKQSVGKVGKLVWAEIATVIGVDDADRRGSAKIDIEGWPNPWDDAQSALADDEVRYTIELGDVPTDLLVAAKAHVDNLVRELTLASYDSNDAARESRDRLGGQLVDLVRDVVTGFSEARQSIKRQALAAAQRGEERTALSLRIPVSLAEAGERYLAALDSLDEFARAARLLTVESPPAHRAFRHWYVQSLVDQLRAMARGETPGPPMTFERFLLGEVSSIAAAHRLSDRAARLQRITAALAGALRPLDVAHVTVAECVATMGASGGAVVLVDQAGARSIAGEIALPDLDPAGWPVDDVLATGKAVWPRGPADPATAPLCAVPLSVAGDVIGVLALSFSAVQMFDSEERAWVEAVAAEAAQTLARTRLHEEQVRLAERLARLQSVAAELGRRSDVAEVQQAALQHTTAAVGAVIGTLCLPTADREQLRLMAAVGQLREDDAWQSFPVDGPFPASKAYRTGRPLVVEPIGPAESAEFAALSLRYPLVCLPLKVDEEVSGVLTLSFARGRRLSPAELDFVVALADVCAQAIARAHALEHATHVSDRFAFLAEASRRLASSLNYNETLQTVADLAVPRLADWCGIDVLEDADIVPVAVAHVDPAKVSFARRFRQLYPPSLESLGGIARVIATGESLLISDVTDDMLVSRAIDERHLGMVRELGMASVLIVPLTSSSRVVGGLTLIRGDRNRPFNAGEVELAEDIGRRAGTAVDNARLFREVQAAWHTDSGTSHARLDLALAAAAIGSFDWDLHSDAVTCDTRMQVIFGVEGARFDGRMNALLDAIVPGDRQAFDAAIERAIGRVGDFSTEYRIRRPDAAVRWVETRGRVLPGADGAATRIIGIAFDSTELREARDRVARTLEHMADAFFSLDADLRFTYVNAAAERLLARERRFLLGCHVLEEFPDSVGGRHEDEYRRALETQRAVTFEHYAADSGRHFEVRVQPIPDGLGVYYTDVSQSRQFEQERAELRAASRHARSEAEVARSRLAFIAEASADITTTLDPVEVCRRVATHAVDRLADWVSIYVVEGGQCHRVAAAHRDADRADVASMLVDAYPIDLTSDAMVARAVRSRMPVLRQHMTEQMVAATYPDPQARELVDGMGVSSAFVVPMVAGDEVVGAMAFVRSMPDNEFEADEVQLAVTLASRAALAVQNAQLYARQTTVAQALQQAVLPEALPVIDGIELSARYEPALGGAGIGGDFYDVFRLPSGRVALAVGDAAGHGVQSGALMGQLRNALRAYAVQERGPVVTLRSLSDMIAGLEPDAFATAFYAELDPTSGELAWASAGHPPPLLTYAGRPPQYLDGFASPPLGIFTASDVDGGALVLPPGGGILMYTDGLIERRGVDLSHGLDTLRSLVARQSDRSAAVDAVVHGMREDAGFADDVCVLFAVRGM